MRFHLHMKLPYLFSYRSGFSPSKRISKISPSCRISKVDTTCKTYPLDSFASEKKIIIVTELHKNDLHICGIF